MPIVAGYLTLAEAKDSLEIPLTDTADDAMLELAIEAASRAIDDFTSRFFHQTALQAREFNVSRHWEVGVDDISTTTGLVVKTDEDLNGIFETTLTLDTDFYLLPLNAGDETPVRPFTLLVLAPQSGRFFPVGVRTLQVTAQWGWPTVPTAIKQATLIQSIRLFKRRQAAFGVTGIAELGGAMRLLDRLDPDVEMLVRPFVKAIGAMA